jgi:hypothetical protein
VRDYDRRLRLVAVRACLAGEDVACFAGGSEGDGGGFDGVYRRIAGGVFAAVEVVTDGIFLRDEIGMQFASP